MGLRINTNLPSLTAQRSLDINVRKTENAMKQLASGNRFSDVSEGSADYAIAEHMRGQVKSMEAAKSNSEAAMNFTEVAQGGLNEQGNLLIRMRELAVQSASDTYSDTERNMMNYEFQQLSQEVDRIAQSTSYGAQKLLSGATKGYQFQVGAYGGKENIIKYENDTNTTASELGVDGLSVSDLSSAQDALSNIDGALDKIGNARAGLGAIQSRFNSVINYTGEEAIALEDARSRMEDTDVAKAYSEMVKGSALQQYQMAVLAEANRWPGSVLRLIA